MAVISSIRSTPTPQIPLSTSYEVYDPYQIPFVDVTGQYGFTPVWVCPEMYDPACAANDVALAEFLVGTGLYREEYGVAFSDTPTRPYTWQEKVVLMTGTIDVGEYLGRVTGHEGAEAFRVVYGVSVEDPLVYHKCSLQQQDSFCRIGRDVIRKLSKLRKQFMIEEIHPLLRKNVREEPVGEPPRSEPRRKGSNTGAKASPFSTPGKPRLYIK